MSWKQILGHDDILVRFRRAAVSNRLAHAYLFVGLPGIGKRLFARQLAKTLLCERSSIEDWDSCDECSACKLVDAGTHPDLHTLARDSDLHEFPIQLVIDFIAELSLKPARGLRRIAVVDDADDFNAASSNALLKTLEEPPPGSIVILIGTGAELQSPTIRSRCHVVPFQPLPIPVVESLLRKDSEIDAAMIPRVARLSGGSLELARELADPAIGQFRTSLLSAMAAPKPDVRQVHKDFMSVIEQAGKESGEHRRRALLVIRLVIRALDAALAQKSPEDAGERQLIERLQSLGSERLVALLERCMSAEEHVERRVQLALSVEGLVDSLLSANLIRR